MQTIASAQKKQAVIQLDVAERKKFFPHGFFTVHKPTLGEKAYKYFNDPFNQIQFNTNPSMAAAKAIFTLADDIKVLGTSFATNGSDSRHIGGKSATFDEKMGSFINVSTTALGIGEAMASRELTFGGDIIKQGEFVETAFNKGRPGNLIGGKGLENFKTFDDFENGIATSYKSVDMALDGALNKPESITSRLNSYTNKISWFEGYKLNGVRITPANITSSNLKVGILGTPNSAQRAALNSAANYAQNKGVGFQLKMLKKPVDPQRLLRSGLIYSSNNILGKKQ